MSEPLFPIRPQTTSPLGAVFVIEPYRQGSAWVFDDHAVGLKEEPFVSGITEMIDGLVAQIPDAAAGFRLLFADHPFAGHQASLTLVRPDPVEGTWYRSENTGEEGWLCPALLWYFPSPPPTIFVRAESKPPPGGTEPV